MDKAVFVLLALAAVSCKGPGDAAVESDNPAAPTGTSANNTGKNERDRDMKTLTPEDQGASEVDRTITQLVRQGVVAKFGATAAAANVKIVTVDRVVTLRGPVGSASEQSTIGTIAGRVDRVKRVDNRLEVASK